MWQKHREEAQSHHAFIVQQIVPKRGGEERNHRRRGCVASLLCGVVASCQSTEGADFHRCFFGVPWCQSVDGQGRSQLGEALPWSSLRALLVLGSCNDIRYIASCNIRLYRKQKPATYTGRYRRFSYISMDFITGIPLIYGSPPLKPIKSIIMFSANVFATHVLTAGNFFEKVIALW